MQIARIKVKPNKTFGLISDSEIQTVWQFISISSKSGRKYQKYLNSFEMTIYNTHKNSMLRIKEDSSSEWSIQVLIDTY